jgi:hypothetical protein
MKVTGLIKITGIENLPRYSDNYSTINGETIAHRWFHNLARCHAVCEQADIQGLMHHSDGHLTETWGSR